MSTEDFFQDSDVKDIAMTHIEKVLNLEEKEAQRILSVYKRVRNDLRDRLDSIPSGTFTQQKLNGALMQVELALKALQKDMLGELDDSSIRIAESGVQNLISEIEKWNKHFTGAVIPINLDAAAIASYTNNLIMSRVEPSVSSYNEFLRSRIAQGLTESIVAEDTLSEVVSKINKTMMGEEWKAQQIVRTELHNVYNQGKLRGMKELWDDGNGDIPDLRKTLFHPMDSRTGKDSMRLAQDNPIVNINDPFVEYSTGKRLEYMSPPNRPNDRSCLIPYRDVWES